MPKVIPFGDRIMVKRRKIGEKAGSVFLPEETRDRSTDLADVVYIPELSFADKSILENADAIISSLTGKAKHGDSDALIALLKLNEFVREKSVMVGDAVMVSRYQGTDFIETGSVETMSLISTSNIIGLVVES